MFVILPGHQRGMIVLGGCTDCAASTPSCCADKNHDPAKNAKRDADRKSHCAVCDNSRGYTDPPVFEFDFSPSGLLELCRLIEPTKLHRLLTDSPYDATAPPFTVA